MACRVAQAVKQASRSDRAEGQEDEVGISEESVLVLSYPLRI